MPLYQVTCSEKVCIDRTYEIEAPDAATAVEMIQKSQGDAGELVDEQVQDTYSFDRVKSVQDENGKDQEF